MSRRRVHRERPDPLGPGAYLTDGNALFSVVGELPHEPSLRLIEDCRTLEILMVHVDDLQAPTVRHVHVTREELAPERAYEPDAPRLRAQPAPARMPQ
ncbi:MAG: hypothetical protein FWD42_04885 [Solirubrobacterales bacterium]|nr:hypothetical protein [Solirubrobacterales bacterium]